MRRIEPDSGSPDKVLILKDDPEDGPTPDMMLVRKLTDMRISVLERGSHLLIGFERILIITARFYSDERILAFSGLQAPNMGIDRIKPNIDDIEKMIQPIIRPGLTVAMRYQWYHGIQPKLKGDGHQIGPVVAVHIYTQPNDESTLVAASMINEILGPIA